MQKDQSESPVGTDDAEPPSSLAQLTAEIVSAYVSNNETALSDVAALITAVAGQLSRIGTEPERAERRSPSRRCLFAAPFSGITCSAWSAVSRRRS